ncbi:MAG TPA: glycosyltransferase family 1 protein [Nitrospira sp.]|jgi:glycosyltransferase involved in cell wall biosynthesis|nr:glycosyltransferase family 1 protein [Nitrospira sp.]
MNLEGVRVLLDGYNLELRHGSGISTYGITLLEALRALKASVSILSGSRTSREPLLNEVLFFDATRERRRSISPSYAISALKAVTGVGFRPKPLELGRIVERVSAGRFVDEVAPLVKLYALGDCYQVSNAFLKWWGKTTYVPNPDRIEIWHATSPLPIRIRKAKTITTIHDIIPLRLPHMTLEDKTGFYRNIKNAIRDSDHLICISESAKSDLLDFFDVDPERISVLYQPTALAKQDVDEAKIDHCLSKHDLRQGRYLLYVGAIEPRKNLAGLAKAYAGLDTDVPLVLVGKRNHYWKEELRELDAVKNLRMISYVSREDLACLYAGAYFFIFPSFYEGFGLPPVEAMNFGCPVIASDVSSIPEVCGEAALYVDPNNIQDIRAKMQLLLSDHALRTKLSLAGLERAKRFSMSNYVPQLLEVYQKVLG